MEAKGLEKDFLMMIEAQKRTIYKVCYIYANDQDDLNDLFQETVLNLWKSFPRYRGIANLPHGSTASPRTPASRFSDAPTLARKPYL